MFSFSRSTIQALPPLYKQHLRCVKKPAYNSNLTPYFYIYILILTPYIPGVILTVTAAPSK